jgi:two-component system, LuxR family, response regulator FixJ
MPNSAPLRTAGGASAVAPGRDLPVAVVIVDDDDAVRRSLSLMLRANGYQVHDYGSGAQLLRSGLPSSADILLADYAMPGMDGLDLVRRLRARGWKGAAVLITGRYDSGLAARAASEGVKAVLEKPLEKRALLAALEQA